MERSALSPRVMAQENDVSALPRVFKRIDFHRSRYFNHSNASEVPLRLGSFGYMRVQDEVHSDHGNKRAWKASEESSESVEKNASEASDVVRFDGANSFLRILP